MTDVRLNEPTITALVAKLTTDLPAIIDNINVQQTTPNYPLAYPVSVLDYIPTVAELHDLPVIGIADGDIHLQDDTGWEATGQFQLTVVAFCQSQDQRELAWRLRRYSQAIIRCLRGTNQLGNSWGIVVDHVRPGPTLGRDESPRQWLSTTAVTFTFKTDQTT